MDENTIKINWEDAPEGATHYDPDDLVRPWNKLEEGKLYYFLRETSAWEPYCGTPNTATLKEFLSDFIPKPEATLKEQPYTEPKADPFAVALKQSRAAEYSLGDYLASIYAKVDQEGGRSSAELHEILSDISGVCINETGDKLQKKDLNVSWYDYDKEELIGLPEKGEIVYDNLQQEDVEYLGKLHYEDIIILEDVAGRCYERDIIYLKPLNYKDSPKHQARKEQHKLLEVLVGDVDSNLQGYTHKGGAIELYNKGWRVSKEDV